MIDSFKKKVGEAIAIEHKKKNVKIRGKTVMRIANNEYVPKEDAKAGFAYNPFGENEAVKRNRAKRTVKRNN